MIRVLVPRGVATLEGTGQCSHGPTFLRLRHHRILPCHHLTRLEFPYFPIQFPIPTDYYRPRWNPVFAQVAYLPLAQVLCSRGGLGPWGQMVFAHALDFGLETRWDCLFLARVS